MSGPDKCNKVLPPYHDEQVHASQGECRTELRDDSEVGSIDKLTCLQGTSVQEAQRLEQNIR